MTRHDPIDPTRAVTAGEPEVVSSQDVARRGFLGIAGMAAALGVMVPFARNAPQGLVPAAFAQDAPDGAALLAKAGKHPDLAILGDRPFVAETP